MLSNACGKKVAIFILCSLLQMPSVFAKDPLPVTRPSIVYVPQSTPLSKWVAGNIKEEEKLSPVNQGHLASDLLDQLSDYLAPFSKYKRNFPTEKDLIIDAAAVQSLSSRILAIYPHLPVQNQAWLSGSLLDYADMLLNPSERFAEANPPVRHYHRCNFSGTDPAPQKVEVPEGLNAVGEKFIAAVFDAWDKHPWVARTDEKERLAKALTKATFPEALKGRAEKYISMTESANFVSIQSDAKILSELVDKYNKLPAAKNVVPPPPQLDPDAIAIGLDKKIRANVSKIPVKDKPFYHKDMGIWHIAPDDAKTITACAGRILSTYATLDDCSRAKVAEPILTATNLLMRSNLRSVGDKLFWPIFNSIPTNCLDNGSVASGLCNNYFVQANRVVAAEKIYRKYIELQDFQYGSIGGQTNFRSALAGVLESEGKFTEAIAEYDYIIRANKWRATCSIPRIEAWSDEQHAAEQRRAILRRALGLK